MMKILHKILLAKLIAAIAVTTLFTGIFNDSVQPAYAKKDNENFIKITDLDDLDAGIWSGESNDVELVDDLCVYSTTGSYKITAEGSAPSGKFKVYNTEDSKESIDFRVYWNDEAFNNSGEEQLTTKKESLTQSTSEIEDENCNNGTVLTARIRIVFNYNDLVASFAGSYSGTVTLTVQPI